MVGKESYAKRLLQLALNVCNEFKMDLTKSKLGLIKMSLFIKNGENYDYEKKLTEIENKFNELNNDLGVAETHLLRSIWKIN